jgi:hypothetical protein
VRPPLGQVRCVRAAGLACGSSGGGVRGGGGGNVEDFFARTPLREVCATCASVSRSDHPIDWPRRRLQCHSGRQKRRHAVFDAHSGPRLGELISGPPEGRCARRYCGEELPFPPVPGSGVPGIRNIWASLAATMMSPLSWIRPVK